MNGFELKPGLQLGISSPATAVYGGDLGHSWNRWHQRGKTAPGSWDPAVAAGGWDRWREDALLIKSMGISTCRIGVEWARIQPEKDIFDEKAMDHVKEELMFLLALGIKPLLTLHHFTNPIWIENDGGWENHETSARFLRYVDYVVRSVGHLVDEYITINEPNLYALKGYRSGSWPPGKTSSKSTTEVISVMAATHIKAYRLIHDVRRAMGFSDTRVGFVLSMSVFEPKNRMNPVHIASAAAAEKFIQTRVAEAMMRGDFNSGIKNLSRTEPGVYCDFIGMNYHARITVAGTVKSARERAPKDDLGNEIYPDGIARCAEALLKTEHMPVYVFNGACDGTDSFRSRYIYEHLGAVCRAGHPIERYYYESFMDGFFWGEQPPARLGLVYVDRETLSRKLKASGNFYSEIIKNCGVTEDMYDTYVAGQCYHYLSPGERHMGIKK